jgi:transcriptional/translational regulatory protein YebC/TACO1
VSTSYEDFIAVKDAVETAGLAPEHAEIIEKPTTDTVVSEDDAEKIMRLIDTLEDLDDVQEVYTNADFTDDVLAKLQ